MYKKLNNAAQNSINFRNLNTTKILSIYLFIKSCIKLDILII
jgi:hypothetical protein